VLQQRLAIAHRSARGAGD